MAVFCQRACYESHSGMDLEEEVVDLSEDESERWCRLLFLLSMWFVIWTSEYRGTVQSVPEVVRRRLTPRSELLKSLRGSKKQGAVPPEGTATRLGPPKDPPMDMDEKKVEDANVNERA